MLFALLLCVIVSYLIGSIPFGLILARSAGLGDVRTVGSGNIGATNVLRLGNKKIAALTLALDIAKGVVAITLAVQLITLLMPITSTTPECIDHDTFNFLYDSCGYSAGKMEYVLIIAGFAAVLGHMFPVWLKYKGGKGVATFFGVILGFMWPAGLLTIATWIVVAILSRRSSVAALTATAITPIYMLAVNTREIMILISGDLDTYAFESLWAIMICIVMVGFIWYQHRENIKRLRAGTEPKIGSLTP